MAESAPPLTADQLRARFGADVFVALPDGGTWHCRRPDLKTLIVERLVPLPLLERAMQDLEPNVDGSEKTVEQLTSQSDPGMAAFIALWCRHAAKAPRIVEMPDEAGPDAIWIGDVPLVVRTAIFLQTCLPASRRVPAVDEFPARTDGTTAVSSGDGVRDTTERPPAGDGSDRGV